MAEVVEDLFGGCRNVFGIGFERSAERGKVREALFLGDGSHFSFDAVDFAETELVDLVRSHARCGPGVNVVLVALLRRRAKR